MTDPAPSPLAGKNVFVTGGAGFFGQAFVRRALADGARWVCVFSRSESRQAEMRAQIDDPRLSFRLGDVRDKDRLVQAMRDVDIVIHAAAQKRIDSCQSDPREAMLTNIVGTCNVSEAAIECGVKQAILLSTDKSPSATTVYGASKLFAEGLWNASGVYAKSGPTRFAAVRYGNVLNSTGSVVPLWKAQAARGEPLTITDRRMTRFLLRDSDAVDLVVLALEEMRGGEVFLPILNGARMVDLAEAVAPGAEVREIGIRGLEKLHEILVSDDEVRHTRRLDSCFIIAPDSKRGKPVSDHFMYRSDTGSLMSVAHLRALVA